MSYSLVELEIDRLVAALEDIDSECGNLDSAFEACADLFASIQLGLENHIEECRGVVEALRDAREKLSQ